MHRHYKLKWLDTSMPSVAKFAKAVAEIVKKFDLRDVELECARYEIPQTVGSAGTNPTSEKFMNGKSKSDESIKSWITKILPPPSETSFSLRIEGVMGLHPENRTESPKKLIVCVASKCETSYRAGNFEYKVPPSCDLRITVRFRGALVESFEDQKDLSHHYHVLLDLVEQELGAKQKKSFNLALSGGGFRATFFHLGVVRALRDLGLLNSLHSVSSVSGGSIVAGDLFANWGAYASGDDRAFDERVEKIIELASEDLRRKVSLKASALILLFYAAAGALLVGLFMWARLRLPIDSVKLGELLQSFRSSFSIPTLHEADSALKIFLIVSVGCLLLSLLFKATGGIIGHFSSFSTWLTHRRLSRLFNYRTLEEVRKDSREMSNQGSAPFFFFNTTSLNSANLCAFTGYGFIRDASTFSGSVLTRSFLPRFAGVTLGKAVMASAAFPVFFGPVRLRFNKRLDRSAHDKSIGACGAIESLADGGLFDNSGVSLLRNNLELNQKFGVPNQELAAMIVSDAASAIAVTTGLPYRTSFLRLRRSINILMDSKSIETLRNSALDPEKIVIPIEQACTFGGHLVQPAANLSPEIVEHLAHTRTDLDQFNEFVIRGLVQHGYTSFLDKVLTHHASGNQRVFDSKTVERAKELLRANWYQGYTDFKHLNEYRNRIERDRLSGNGIVAIFTRETRGFLRVALRFFRFQ